MVPRVGSAHCRLPKSVIVEARSGRLLMVAMGTMSSSRPSNMKNSSFNPESDIPDLTGKVILVTGGNTGLGEATVRALAKNNPQRIYVAARNPQKCATAIEAIRTQVPNAPLVCLECDLASLSSVQAAAKCVVSESSRLDILICNAGVMCLPPGLSADGFEIQFATNHLGHALLIKLLLPTLLSSFSAPADVRIVSLASHGYAAQPSGGILFDTLDTPQDWTPAALGTWQRYGQSKLANILYAAELARQHPAITSVAVHPGVSHTQMVASQGFWTRALINLSTLGQAKSAEETVHNTLWAATAPREDVVNGRYYQPVGVPAPQAWHSHDEELARKLWERTDKALEGYTL